MGIGFTVHHCLKYGFKVHVLIFFPENFYFVHKGGLLCRPVEITLTALALGMRSV